eukprot:scaffold1376_cov93-Skeletonema_dohrnii-CCMP3373.AAC.1
MYLSPTGCTHITAYYSNRAAIGKPQNLLFISLLQSIHRRCLKGHYNGRHKPKVNSSDNTRPSLILLRSRPEQMPHFSYISPARRIPETVKPYLVILGPDTLPS